MNKMFVDEGVEAWVLRRIIADVRKNTSAGQGSFLSAWQQEFFNQIATDPEMQEHIVRHGLVPLLKPVTEMQWRKAHKLTGHPNDNDPDGLQLDIFMILGEPVKPMLAYSAPEVPGGHLSMTSREAPIFALGGQSEVTLKKARDTQIIGLRQFEQYQEAIRRAGGNANALLIDVADK